MLAKPSLFKRNHDSETDSNSAPQYPTNVSGSTHPLNSSRTVSQPAVYGSKPEPVSAAINTSKPTPEKGNSAKAETPAGSKLIVGPDVKLKGAEILDCDTLVVEGRVEATMDSRVIQIAGDGAFSGKVVIDIAEIYGKFDGELTARSQLIVHSTGRVSGKIRYGKILIEEGGELSGEVAALGDESGKSKTANLDNAKEVAVS